MFDQNFVKLCLDFLEKPFFFIEIGQFQQAIGQFLIKLDAEFDVETVSLLQNLSRHDIELNFYYFVCQQLQEMDEVDVINEEFLVKMKQIVQIGTNCCLLGNCQVV